MTYWPSLSDGQSGLQLSIDNFRQLEVAEKTRLVGGDSTSATIDTLTWTTTATGSGTVTSPSGGYFTVATGTTANSTVMFTSTRKGRFLTGTVNHYLGGIRFGDIGTANNIRNFGVYSSTNGVFFQLNGTTFNVVSRFAGSDTVVSSASFSNAQPVIDTNFHVYEIAYSAGSAYFYQDRILLHILKTSTSAIMADLSQPINAENNNSGGSTTNVNLYLRGTSLCRIGKRISVPTFYHSAITESTIIKSSMGTLVAIIINSLGIGSTLTIYDSLSGPSGNVIAVADTTSRIGYSQYDLEFQNGLTIVTTSTGYGAAAADITIIYE